MDQSKGYVDVDYLQMAAELLRPHKERTYALMRLTPGASVLDVGCGPGTDTLPLAERVGAAGRVIGVDHDAAMLAEADRRARAAGLAGRTRHVRGDAAGGLALAANQFDACRSERVFQHLARPELALAEMVRVTRPGGWVVVLDTDHGTKSFDTPEVEIERRLARVAAERCLTNGYAGRQLYRLFKRQALVQVTVEAIALAFTHYALARAANFLERVEREALAAEVVTPAEVRRWQASLEAADAAGEFFASGTGVIVAGQKPG